MAGQEIEHNPECTSESFRYHLCYIVSQGFHLNDKNGYKALTDNPRFKCRHCGRVSNSAENLCVPVEL